MHKLKLFFLLIVITTIHFTCKQSVKGSNGVVYKSAVEYNNYIIERQKILIKNVMDFVKVSQTDLDSADKILDKNVAEISDMINDINEMPDYNGDSSLRIAAINLFKFHKNLSENVYKRLIEIRRSGKDSTPEEVAEIKDIVEQVTKEEAGYDKGFRNAQKDFAEKNNMKLADNELQKNIDPK